MKLRSPACVAVRKARRSRRNADQRRAKAQVGDQNSRRQIGRESYRRMRVIVYAAAGATACRGTGFSTIGRLISADKKPNNTPPHQMML